MSMPILYPSTESAFSDNGIGILTDVISCEVTEERNGVYELMMTYPISGIHYADIATRSLIMAKPSPIGDPQPFRIYRITRPLNGMVTIYAEHISYDLSGIPVSPFNAYNAPDAMAKMEDSAAVDSPFHFWTDKDTQASMTVSAPSSSRSLLGGKEGSILDVYGGEYKFDRYTVMLYGQRGLNRGVSIRYGKNLTGLEQDENCSSVYTGVYPYWIDSAGNMMELPEKIVNAEGTYNFTRILPLDLSSEWQEAPTEEQMRSRAESYMKDNDIGVPKVSLTVEFAQLEQTEEYKDIALLERVELCDTVNVEFPELAVSATAKCIKTVYDVLLDRYISIDLGDARANIADTIADQQKQIEEMPNTTTLMQKMLNLTATILGADGGSVRLIDTNGDGDPDVLYIADDPDPAKAKKVWRFNYEGWGASQNGYNGPFELGATFDDGMLANFITAGILNAALVEVVNLNASNINTGTLNGDVVNVTNLNADNIVGGTLRSQNNKTRFYLQDGSLRFSAQFEDGSTGDAVFWERGINFLTEDGTSIGGFAYGTIGNKYNIVLTVGEIRSENKFIFGGKQVYLTNITDNAGVTRQALVVDP